MRPQPTKTISGLKLSADSTTFKAYIDTATSTFMLRMFFMFFVCFLFYFMILF